MPYSFLVVYEQTSCFQNKAKFNRLEMDFRISLEKEHMLEYSWHKTGLAPYRRHLHKAA